MDPNQNQSPQQPQQDLNQAPNGFSQPPQAPPVNQYPSQQQPYGQQAQTSDPGQVFGVLSLATIPLGIPAAGIFLGYIGKMKSKEAGFSGSLSNIAFIANIILTILMTLLLIPLVAWGLGL